MMGVGQCDNDRCSVVMGVGRDGCSPEELQTH